MVQDNRLDAYDGRQGMKGNFGMMRGNEDECHGWGREYGDWAEKYSSSGNDCERQSPVSAVPPTNRSPTSYPTSSTLQTITGRRSVLE